MDSDSSRTSPADAPPTSFIAPTAIVEVDVFVGSRVKIWHNVQVRAGARIGDDAIIGTGCFIDANVVVGDRSKIQNGSQIYAPAIVGAGVFIGPLVVLTNDVYPRAVTPNGNQLGADDWNPVGCVVEDGASIGAGTVVICTQIGSWALVGAGSVVSRPVEPHALVVGNPARQIGWVCFCGLRLEGVCSTCGWRSP
jgi:UDP-2-acetamido-3-amino-2,3-dideoxy-glucuronate N-acetyltransferase